MLREISVLALLLCLTSARAEETQNLTMNGPDVTTFKPISGGFTVNFDGDTRTGRAVTIYPDGSIEYGKGYTPSDAAKVFWDQVGIERKARNCQ